MEQVFGDAFKVLGFPEEEADELSVRVRESFLNPDAWTVFEDVEACLEALTSDGWKHIVLSNHVPELAELIANLSLDHHFDMILTSAQTGYEKPHSGAFKVALEYVPKDCQLVMVGDSYTADVLGAESNGIPAILVRRQDSSARLYAENLEGIVEMLDNLFP